MEGVLPSGERSRMIWHHCRRFGVGTCKHNAVAKLRTLCNFALWQLGGTKSRVERLKRPWQTCELPDLNESQGKVCIIEQPAFRKRVNLNSVR